MSDERDGNGIPSVERTEWSLQPRFHPLPLSFGGPTEWRARYVRARLELLDQNAWSVLG